MSCHPDCLEHIGYEHHIDCRVDAPTTAYDAQESQAILNREQRRRQANVLEDIAAERRSQDAKWGPVSINSFLVGHSLAVLVEEVGEVAEAQMHNGKLSDELREELVQVAAVAAAWIELIDLEREELSA